MSSVNNGSNENVAARSTNYDNTKPASDKRKTAAMTRRMSFSTTRPWSSYAENYSSCLSGLRRRNSSSVQSQRKGSLQSSRRSSLSDLSRSFDEEQLKKLKTNAASDDDKQTFKVSALYARPFHQRRWTSPVAFPVANISKQLTQHVKDEAVSTDEAFLDSADKKKDKISESEEVTLSHVQYKPNSISTLQNTEDEDKSPQDILSSSVNSTMERSPTNCSDHEKGQKEDKKATLRETDEGASSTVTDATGSIISTVITDAPKTEEPVQKRNIYTEMKKNSKWSCSKRFRRRHHTIHADSHRFLNHNLFTITEQSNGSFGATNNAQNSSNAERNSGWKLQPNMQRSKSLNDLTMSKQGTTNIAVFVQRLASNSLCVPVAESSKKQKCATAAAVQYPSGGLGSNAAIESVQQHPVQVNVQSFNNVQRSNQTKPKFRAVMCGEQPKTIPQCKNQAIRVSTPQHAIFTQAKTKLASITISQV